MSESPFQEHAQEYDAWYDAHPTTFASELAALRQVLPPPGRWVEVGVGTGRFAHALRIPTGIEPAGAMARLARERGIAVLPGCAEDLPLAAESVDAVFFITTLCFVRDMEAALSETRRVLVRSGVGVFAFLPSDSELGTLLERQAPSDLFFRWAKLHSRLAMLDSLRAAGFSLTGCAQTLLGPPEAFESSPQSPVAGWDQGSFVVLRAKKSREAQ